MPLDQVSAASRIQMEDPLLSQTWLHYIWFLGSKTELGHTKGAEPYTMHAENGCLIC